jgi:hypothetical protein
MNEPMIAMHSIGGLMLAAGVKERAAQIRVKAEKKEQQRQIDGMYHALAEEVIIIDINTIHQSIVPTMNGVVIVQSIESIRVDSS